MDCLEQYVLIFQFTLQNSQLDLLKLQCLEVIAPSQPPRTIKQQDMFQVDTEKVNYPLECPSPFHGLMLLA